MKLSYFPGCTVRAQEEEFENESLLLLEKLGFTVEELPEWECCGAVYPLTVDDYFSLLSTARAVKNTADEGSDGLLTLCSACYHVLKRAHNRIVQDSEARQRVEKYLADEYDDPTYPVDIKVLHLVEIFRDYVGLEEVTAHTTHSLEGDKIATYYGCLFLRPEEDMQLTDPEAPAMVERFIEALGGEPVNFAYRTDCCGAYHIYSDENVSTKISYRIINSAKQAGATEIITACPLCKHNLEYCQENPPADMEQIGEPIPINYISTPFIRAFGGKDYLKQRRAQKIS